MKKFLVTILAFAYLTSTFGATLRLDCCIEKLVAISLGTATHDTWSKLNNSDCKDDHQQAKLSHEQKRNDTKIRVAKFTPAFTPTEFPVYAHHITSALATVYPVNHAPPRNATIPLFILHCVHRI